MIRLRPVPKPTQLTDALALELTQQFIADPTKRVWDKTYIVKTLLSMSADKCCYCECKVHEESKYMEVEHYFCKSLYKEKVVEWENLLPACKRCNGNKSDHDTGLEPIIHPVNDDPRTHLSLRSYRFSAKTSIGRMTIAVLDLNNIDRLQQKRFEVGSGVKQALDDLESGIQDFLGNPTSSKRTKIRSRLLGIMHLGQWDKEYSATVATEILCEPSYEFAKTEFTKLGFWDAEFHQLEAGLRQVAFL